MTKINSLTELDVNTKDKQVDILNTLNNILKYAVNNKNVKLPAQTIANNLGLILETKTVMSDALLSSFHNYNVYSIAILYDKIYSYNNNIRNHYILLNLKNLMRFCDKHFINYNDYWITIDTHNNVNPIDTNTLQSVVNFVYAKL